MNVPNILSSIRILSALTVPFLLIDGSLWVRIVVGIACVLTVLTDWFDGWYARKYNKITKLGKILDPIADKIYVIVCFSVLAYLDILWFWWIIPIVVREVVITVYRFIFLEQGTVVAAAHGGKVKTVLQMLTIGLGYIVFMIKHHLPEYYHESFWWIIALAMALTLFHTLHSGYSFFAKNWKLVKAVHGVS
jgi:CDP-diacylglycerol--glycerol-3-phosphate 3-phosphatidyltransferase